MGKMIEQIALSRHHDIVCVIDVDNAHDFDSPAFKSADVAIEFTTPATAAANVRKCFAAGVPVVCGSTGWLASLDAVLEDMRRSNGTLFYSSNYSIGVNIFFAVNRYLAKIMNGFSQYNPEMTEIHHIHKKDHPSGTAITLAQGIIENLERKTAWTEQDAAPHQLLINHEREGEVPGTHIITYTSPVDKITISHEAFSREGFALGAVLAAEWLPAHPGFHQMPDLLDFLTND